MKARAVAAIALSGALALGLSGCNLWLDVETQRSYEPSDGVSVDVGDLQVRNLMVISEDGELGNLLGAVVNTTGSPINFTVQWDAAGSYHEVALTADAYSTSTVGVDEQQLISPLDAIPGSLLEVVVHTADDQKGILVPVLDGTLAEYSDAIPTPAAEG